jgi:hypothetical protein
MQIKNAHKLQTTSESLTGKKKVFRSTYLWRGMKNLTVENSKDFLESGGCEAACMSTSRSLKVVTGLKR